MGGALGGRVLPTGTVRTIVHGPVPRLPGYDDGAWWVQDAAAALPAQLLGDVRGKSVADLCAAPGGKTAQLAAAGAQRHRGRPLGAAARAAAAEPRAARPRRRNRRRRRDGMAGGPFDAVLLDAPCSATGTIRRHPDIPWLKRESDIATLAALQRRLLARAVELTRPGGVLVYCTCSLEPEEGVEHRIEAAGARTRAAPAAGRSRARSTASRNSSTAAGDLRTLPCQLPDPDPQMGGLDGFYAARLERV